MRSPVRAPLVLTWGVAASFGKLAPGGVERSLAVGDRAGRHLERPVADWMAVLADEVQNGYVSPGTDGHPRPR